MASTKPLSEVVQEYLPALGIREPLTSKQAKMLDELGMAGGPLSDSDLDQVRGFLKRWQLRVLPDLTASRPTRKLVVQEVRQHLLLEAQRQVGDHIWRKCRCLAVQIAAERQGLYGPPPGLSYEDVALGVARQVSEKAYLSRKDPGRFLKKQYIARAFRNAIRTQQRLHTHLGRILFGLAKSEETEQGRRKADDFDPTVFADRLFSFWNKHWPSRRRKLLVVLRAYRRARGRWRPAVTLLLRLFPGQRWTRKTLWVYLIRAFAVGVEVICQYGFYEGIEKDWPSWKQPSFAVLKTYRSAGCVLARTVEILQEQPLGSQRDQEESGWDEAKVWAVLAEAAGIILWLNGAFGCG